MKTSTFLKLTLMALSVCLMSCKTQTSIQKPASVKTTEQSQSGNEQLKVLHKVTDNAQYAQCITSKIKFKINLDGKELSLGGNLKMKRNDVIRLQLTALGLIEAGRMEFTKDYVLVMDRLNKQYIKVNYDQVDFLRQSGLNFYSLQALFWNELFLPGTDRVTDESLKSYTVNLAGAATDISLNRGHLKYQWQANKASNLIQHFDGSYADSQTGTIKIDWNYGAFKPMGSKQFPTQNTITLTVPQKKISVDLQLSSPNNDSDWETRTEVTSKYRKVSLDDILKKLSAL